jgi:hypothetical protein
MKRLLLLATAVVWIAGCGTRRLPVYPVSGQVTVNGVPATGWMAMLHFEPAPTGSLPHRLPRAAVGPDGRFQFHTFGRDDGAPAGTYRLSFTLVNDKDPLTPRIKRLAPDGTREEQVTRVYIPEPVEIHPESNALPAYDLK